MTVYNQNVTGYLARIAEAVGSLSASTVVGPASSVDNTLARFDGTTGKLLQGGGPIVDDSGIIYGGAAANDDITINGTSHATKTTSYVLLQSTGGNVGIGTAAPAEKLDVAGVVQSSGGFKATGGIMGPSGNAQIFVQSSGNANAVIEAGAGGIATLRLYRSGVLDARIVGGTGTTDNLGFHTAATERMRISPTGNVGIGETNPTSKLKIAGGSLNLAAYTVATLPGSPVVGDQARVTDALAPAIGSTVANGGAAHAGVVWNGANWTVNWI